MAIDPELALTAQPRRTTQVWQPEDVILYHLGIGAGAAGAADLHYVYERDLQVLPTFSVVPGLAAAGDLNDVPGVSIDPVQALHVGQDVLAHRPLPPSGEVTSTSRVIDLADKGSAAIIRQEVVACDDEGPLFTNVFTIFARGEGGFPSSAARASGELPLEPQRQPLPARNPDFVMHVPTSGAQAALYRLSGDRNPLHVDPAVAAAAGFDRPILHGLCTLGVVTRAVVDEVLSSDATRVTRVATRFSGAMFPGETLRLSGWKEADKVMLEVGVEGRPGDVLREARVEFTSHEDS